MLKEKNLLDHYGLVMLYEQRLKWKVGRILNDSLRYKHIWEKVKVVSIIVVRVLILESYNLTIPQLVFDLDPK